MKRKRIVKVPTPENMSVADTLVVAAQTIIVVAVTQKGIDPHEAYDEWQANIEPLLAVSQTLSAILEQYGDQLDVLKFTVPEGVGMGGYRVEELNLFGKDDGLPF